MAFHPPQASQPVGHSPGRHPRNQLGSSLVLTASLAVRKRGRCHGSWLPFRSNDICFHWNRAGLRVRLGDRRLVTAGSPSLPDVGVGSRLVTVSGPVAFGRSAGDLTGPR